jgi:hypothetical protein
MISEDGSKEYYNKLDNSDTENQSSNKSLTSVKACGYLSSRVTIDVSRTTRTLVE